jgi:hypothetical protein
MARLRRSAAPSCPLTGRSSGPPAGRHPHPRQNWPIGNQRILTMEPGRGERTGDVVTLRSGRVMCRAPILASLAPFQVANPWHLAA